MQIYIYGPTSVKLDSRSGASVYRFSISVCTVLGSSRLQASEMAAWPLPGTSFRGPLEL